MSDQIEIQPWPTEQPLLALSFLVGLLIWIAVVFSVIGLFYAAIFGIFFGVAHLIFVAQVRGSAVRLGPDQFPELHATVERLARRMGLDPTPEAYLMQAGGALNAFATKFLRSHLIVLYSDLLEACGDDTSPSGCWPSTRRSAPESRFAVAAPRGPRRSSSDSGARSCWQGWSPPSPCPNG